MQLATKPSSLAFFAIFDILLPTLLKRPNPQQPSEIVDNLYTSLLSKSKCLVPAAVDAQPQRGHPAPHLVQRHKLLLLEHPHSSNSDRCRLLLQDRLKPHLELRDGVPDCLDKWLALLRKFSLYTLQLVTSAFSKNLY